MNAEQRKRAHGDVATVLLTASCNYKAARDMALATNLCAVGAGEQRSRAWLDLDSASSEIGHAFASYVAFGHDPVAKLRVGGHGLGERATVWGRRVAEDIAARLRGEPGTIPSTDDLPAPTPAVPL